MTDLPDSREALSWGIAAALARRHPQTEVHRSLQPEGVGYDTLVLRIEGRDLALLNRGGRAHVGDNAIEWERVVGLGIYAVVELIESANGLTFGGNRPSTTPRVLTYWTISSILNNAVFGKHSSARRPMTGLDVEPCHWDNMWDDSPATWVTDFPELRRRVDKGPCFHHFWHVKGPGISIAFDAPSGEAWSRRGEYLDLPAAYSSAGRSFERYIRGVETAART